MRLHLRTLAAFMIFLLILPLILISIPTVAILLLTGWSCRTTPFGNYKWGDGVTHPSHGIDTFWERFVWLVFRNPVNNVFHALGCWFNPATITFSGDLGIGDKLKGGSYLITMGACWEYYLIKPYTLFGQRRCMRLRHGWKLNGGTGFCDFVFTFNPIKQYMGE